MRWEILLLALSICANIAFLDHDLPDVTHPDEPKVVRRAMAMGTGDLNPHFFLHPTLWIYCLFAVQGFGVALGLLLGWFDNLSDLEARAFLDPSYFFLAARVLTALLATTTAWLSWIYARRFGAVAGVIASGLVAVLPPVVRYAHIATPDIPMSFAVLLVVISSVRACLNPGDPTRRLLLAAVFAGIATSIKYNGSMSIACVIAATTAIGLGRRWRWRRVIATGFLATMVSLLTLLATSPFIVLEWSMFLAGLTAVRDGSITIAGSAPDSLYYARQLVSQFGPVVLVASLAGGALLARGAFGSEGRTFLLIGLAFIAPYATALHLADDKQIRHILPIVPLVAIMAGCAGEWVFRKVSVQKAHQSRRWSAASIVVVALIFAAFVQPVTMTVRVLETFAEPTAPASASRWLRDHLPRSTATFIDAYSRVTLPPDRETVEARVAAWRQSDDPASRQLARVYARYLDSGAAEHGFRLLPTESMGLNTFASGYDVRLDYTDSRLDSVSWVIAPDWSLRPTGREQRDAFYRRVQQDFRRVHTARDNEGQVVLVFARDPMDSARE